MDDVEFSAETECSCRAIRDAIFAEQSRLRDLGIGSRVEYTFKTAHGPNAVRELRKNWAINLAHFIARFAK